VTQEHAPFDETNGSMLGVSDVLSWHRYTGIVAVELRYWEGASAPSLHLKMVTWPAMSTTLLDPTDLALIVQT
jgi:hypothetical protein